MPYCPKCGYEYNPGISKCPDCDEYLVDFPPAKPVDTASKPAEQDHNWIKLARLQSRMQAEMVIEGLHAKDIPSMLYSTAGHCGSLGDVSQFAPSPFEGGYYIMVPLEFAVDADHEGSLMLGEVWEKSRLYDIEE